jgi:hypothetical protein
MRVAIAEAARFPDLASHVYAMARERGGQAVARLLAEGGIQSVAMTFLQPSFFSVVRTALLQELLRQSITSDG